MRGHVKSERYKYVRYDPDGAIWGLAVSIRTKRRLDGMGLMPWVSVPQFFHGVSEAGRKISSSKRFATEREAALFVDKWFLSHGREPVNILVRKP